ncbi:MAG TPA: site-specific integrase, partial [Gaiellaceae bacterium]|nr:site-specific integrase [Gaiellaceae bacterium]
MATSAAIDRFLRHGGLSEATQRAYANDLRAFSIWLERQSVGLADVDARVLADYVGELGRGHRRLAPGSISR